MAGIDSRFPEYPPNTFDYYSMRYLATGNLIRKRVKNGPEWKTWNKTSPSKSIEIIEIHFQKQSTGIE